MRRWLAAFMVAIAALHTVGCRGGNDREQAASASERRAAVRLQPPVPTPAAGHRPFPEHPPIPARGQLAAGSDVLAAMLSIHAHAFWPDRQFPEGVRPMPLDEAVAVLKNDHGPLAALRRRRAAARLGAYGGDRDDFREAVGMLGFNPAILDAGVSPIRPIQNATPTPRDMAIVARESELFDALADPLDTRGCSAKDFYQKTPDYVEVKNSGASVVLNVGITVQRPNGDVARAIDPQKWDVCNPLFSPPEHTYLVELDAQKNPKAVAPKPAGLAYGPELMFERFECNAKGCPIDAWFENVLTVSLQHDASASKEVPDCQNFVTGSDRYSATYGLYEHRAGSASALTIDDGGIWAEAANASSTRVCMHKKLEFAVDADTGAISGAWKVLAAEMGGLLAELACCPVEEEASHFGGVVEPSCSTHHVTTTN